MIDTNPAHYLIGLDHGQAHDYSAWVIVRRSGDGEGANYSVVHADRVRGYRYPDVVEHTCSLVTSLRVEQPLPQVDLVIDYTGVGRPVADLLLEADLGKDSETLVTITSWDSVGRGERAESRVPKRDLASVVQVHLQSERLRSGQSEPAWERGSDEFKSRTSGRQPVSTSSGRLGR